LIQAGNRAVSNDYMGYKDYSDENPYE